MRKLLVIGLDAATWRVMMPLIEQERLPNLQELVEEGTWGTLRSTIPPMSPLAWTSIATGVNAGKHGIYDFVAQDHGTYEVASVNLSHLTQPTIWDIFHVYGRKVGVVNFPLAFPPPNVESFFISGIGSPEQAVYAYPPELDTYLKSRGYRIHPRLRAHDGAKAYFDEVKALTKIQSELTIKLMKQWDWELLWVVFQGLDWVQHYLWDSDINGNNGVEAFYCYMDHVVGQLLEDAGDDWNIILLSDHGFRKIRAEIHLNNILEEWGYLEQGKTSRKSVRGIDKTFLKKGWELGGKLPQALRRRMKQYMPGAIRSDLRELQRSERLRLQETIAWEETRAFSFGYGGRVYIHKKMKYSQGTVTAEEYESLREEIITRLRSLKNPQTGEPVVGEIFRKEDVYIGDQLENAPDIVFTPSDFAYSVYGAFGDAWFHQSRDRVADHDMEGILIMKGKYIRRGVEIDADVVDITPTLLYLHELPILSSMDGRVLREALTEELLNGRQMQAIDSLKLDDKLRYTYDDAEQQDIEERLRDLGYL